MVVAGSGLVPNRNKSTASLAGSPQQPSLTIPTRVQGNMRISSLAHEASKAGAINIPVRHVDRRRLPGAPTFRPISPNKGGA